MLSWNLTPTTSYYGRKHLFSLHREVDKQKSTEDVLVDVLHVLLLRLQVSSLLGHSHVHLLRPEGRQERCGPRYGGVLPGQSRAIPGDLRISLVRIELQVTTH